MELRSNKTAVVILNWNGKQFLEVFLRMIIDRSPEAEIWIADNGSTDDSVPFLRSNFPEVNILVFDRNYGYTGGYNKALSEIEADYYVLLNSDIEVTKDWLKPLISIMTKDPLIAAVQPKIRSFAEKNRFEYAGASGGFIDILGYPFCRGRFIGQKTEIDTGQYDDSREIFWATGAALMVRGELFRKIGGLDQNFFAHMEEIDLCWRLKRAGYKIMVEPSSIVYHVGGGTLPIWSPRKTYLNFRNNISMLYKNLPISKFILIYSIRVFTDILRALSYLIMFKFNFSCAVINGHRDFWKIRKNLDRQNEFGHKNVSNIYRGSIVMRQLLGKGTFGHMMTLFIILGFLLSCSSKNAPTLIEMEKPLATNYKIGDKVTFSVKQLKELDSVSIFVEKTRIKGNEYTINRVGKINYIIVGYLKGNTDIKRGVLNVTTDRVANIKKISILETYPHSTDAYTQGLLFRNGYLYESTGEYGYSTLRQTEISTGKVLNKIKLPGNIFAEGLECVNGNLYQLSWREKTCFVYDLSEFKQTKKLSYNGEGWGLATDGKLLYMSDGSSRIKVINPEKFEHVANIDVADHRGEVNMLNELEWINGKLWANIYLSKWIAVINPHTGEVESYIDCSELETKISHYDDTDVLNGIAYNQENGDIFLTGKKWDKMFKIKIN